MADRFYVNLPLAVGSVVLHGPEAHHLATVLRARPGTAVCLFNGDGVEYPAVVVEVGKREVALDVTGRATPERELPFRVEVAAALPKGDRADFLVEKLTELGMSRFVPLRTQRSVVHPEKVDRLARAVVEASKQCGRNVLMEVASLTNLDDYVRGPNLPATRLLAHFGGGEPPGARGDVACAVGPEGGFTDDEVAAAIGAGWRVVSLGARVLRVETAAIALAARLT